MSAAPQRVEDARLDRALDRLCDHTELVGRMIVHIDCRRIIVREQLEQELGPELTETLLTSLVSPVS